MGKVFLAGGHIGTMFRLPKGYTELVYIQSNGTQWIDTGFKANQNTRIVAQAMFLSGGWIFGSETSWVSNAFGVYFGSSGIVDHGSETTGYSTSLNVLLDVDFNKENIIINTGTTQLLNHTFTSVDFYSGLNTYLFCNNRAGVATEPSSSRFYACKVYDDGMLVRDFVPCLSDADGIGMYDLVEGKFYGNAGTGVFLGSEVV